MGSILILLHGGALSSRMFRTLVPQLQLLGYDTIITPDLPGHGQSKGLGSFTFSNSTKLVHDTIAKVKGQEGNKSRKVLLVGISLGGQAALDVLAKHPADVDTAIVSGASIRPPDESAQWAMPKMPEDKEWMDIIMEDVNVVGMEEAQEIQKQSLQFSFEPAQTNISFPPVLVVVGEHDIPMAQRDRDELFAIVKEKNAKSATKVLQGAWHNHSIDVPEQFAKLIREWDEEVGGT
jgi:pimeloyl-ACP methyl ester carboxylesterase